MTERAQPVPPPDTILMQMLFGAQMQRSICLAARLGIPDLLTKDEYGKLLEASGFRLTRIVPTESPYSVIEGERA